MDQELAQGAVGQVAAYDVKIAEGKLVAVVSAVPASGVSASVTVTIDAIVIIDAIEKAIPGVIDDAVLEVVKAALLK